MFVSSKNILHLNQRVLTPYGYQRIEMVHRTPPLPTLRVRHERGEVVVALHHTFIIDGEELAASDLMEGMYLSTANGPSLITSIENARERELYDISLDQTERQNQHYYADGVLSHNSGKSITVACYLAWLFNFHRDRNIGIVANRASQAKEFLQNTKDIYSRLPIWMMQGVTEWNKTSVANELGMRILTDVPSGDAFRGFTMSVVVVDECAFIKSNVWDEFADSIFPSQSGLSWKKNIIISTAKGINHFYDLVNKAKEAQEDPESKVAFVEVKWDEVPRYDSKGQLMTPEQFKAQVIKRYGKVYFEQNYGNSFLGSSQTLVTPEALAQMAKREPLYVMDEMLKVYEEPDPKRIYLMGVDAAKDGKDFFAVQVVDVTELPFRQVATAKLQVDYLDMPDYLFGWGAEFNTCLMVVENNEGAGQSVADILYSQLEYPNLYFRDTDIKYPGFRTTAKSRQDILRFMQSIINSGRFGIVDAETVQEFMKFELVDGKYQASAGSDDLIMALAIALAPISKVDTYEDFGAFATALKSKEILDTSRYLDVGLLTFSDL